MMKTYIYTYEIKRRQEPTITSITCQNKAIETPHKLDQLTQQIKSAPKNSPYLLHIM